MAASYSLVLTLLCAVVAFVYGNPCGGDDWKYYPGTNACYKLIRDILPWTVAEFKCLFQGAHHVSIHSAEENQFVREVAQHHEIWTSPAYFGKVPVYVNSDQTPYGSYLNWKNGRVPIMNRARRCIKMNPKGEWFQSCCKKKTWTVCKKPASYYVPSWEQPTPAPVQHWEPETTTTTTTTTEAPTTTTTPYYWMTQPTTTTTEAYTTSSTPVYHEPVTVPWVYSTTTPYWLNPNYDTTTVATTTTRRPAWMAPRPSPIRVYRPRLNEWRQKIEHPNWVTVRDEATGKTKFRYILGFRVKRI